VTADRAIDALATPPWRDRGRADDVARMAGLGRTLESPTRPVPEAPVETTLPLAARDAFALVRDFRVHERWIPLTAIEAPPGPKTQVGDAVVAVSAGVFPDRMRVTELTPPGDLTPGVLTVEKEGPVLLGSSTITVTPLGPTQTVVVWDEDVWLAGPLPAGLSRALLAPAFAAMLGRALRSMRRDAVALAHVRDARRR
jgi:hypothetical protein